MRYQEYTTQAKESNTAKDETQLDEELQLMDMIDSDGSQEWYS